MTHDLTVSLAEVVAGAPLQPAEAVTIVRELALRIENGETPGVPSIQVIRLSGSGAITVEGPVAADSRTVLRAAHLLDSLLPGLGVRSTVRVPGALRLAIARAQGTLDLPPYPSLEQFAHALTRFAAESAERCIGELVTSRLTRRQLPAAEPAAIAINAGRHAEAVAITISDIRRARRATGVTLADLAERTRIPASLLCELEWGYLRHWPASDTGRELMARYARAAGLDDQLVVHTAWPLLEEWTRQAGRSEVLVTDVPLVETVPADDDTVDAEPLVRADPIGRRPAGGGAPTAVVARQARRRSLSLAALAVPALVAIGLISTLQERGTSPARSGAVAPAPVVAMAPLPSEADAESPAATTAEVRQAEPEVREADDGRTVHPAEIAGSPTFSPAFATVGSAMFYHTESNGHSALMRADTDGRGSVLRITSVVDDRAQNFHARPSPDGTRIAFDSDRDGVRGVYVADVEGRHVRRVSGEGFAAVPSWSPDGGTLAFVRAEPAKPKVWNLWTVELATGQTRRLTSYRVGQPWGGSWFPDGRRIAYSHEGRLVVLDLATGADRVYRSPVPGTLVRTPAVSPDGTRIVFQVFRRGTWLLDLRTARMKKVLADPSAEEYTWAPDGRHVAYHSRRAGTWGVWVMGNP